ncbi:helix-turn-helix domain-containing protein [Nocardioides marinquilinus]|uniref:Helix-turn-helix domain-containing protein n=1 Tax=Nocardioides marinquilinus TaxID=1210400 RepID=A0ABP9P7Q1_9ACTN
MTAPTDADRAALQGLGLTQYESSGYLALLGREHATPTEVARLAGIPRPRVYDVLASLTDRRLARVVGDKPLRYAAESPELVTERLIGQRQQDAARAAAAARESADRLASLFHLGQGHGDPLDYVEVLRDSREAGRRVQELWNAAEREVLVLVRPPYLAPPSSLEEATVLPLTVRQRAIYDRSLLDVPRMPEVLRRYAELGEEVRIADDLPIKLSVIDGRTVAFNMPDPVAADPSVTTVVIHHEMLAATLAIAFESIWAGAVHLDDAAAPSVGG